MSKQIRSAEAAKRLHCKTWVVKTLIEHGVLHDHNHRNPGQKRHHPLLEVSEVKELARHFSSDKRLTRSVAEGLKAAMKNGHTPVKRHKKTLHSLTKWLDKPELEPPSKTKPVPLLGMTSRLNAIEAKLGNLENGLNEKLTEVISKLEELVKLWS